ncbi:MAG TPA: nicotinate-nucleotide adenylyltransferase [Lachnospiraceae bacterium]|nr:nicotinate-nucleotide adenylyltransferase [Lachnospiraceae bacterium]
METVKRKTGIMGGTFNPIHIGHLILAESARESLGLDNVIFIPSGQPYMKTGMKIADKQMRLEMTRLAIQDNPFFTLSALEVEREGNSYTYETLETLRREEPETDFYFIAGADSLFSMEKWRNPEIIFQNCAVLAAARNGTGSIKLNKQIAYLHKKYKARIEILPMKEFAVSSTDIRTRIQERKSVRYLVPDKVIAYIEKNELYMR